MYSILNIQMRFDFSSVEHQLNLSINFPNFSILLIVSFRAAAEPVFPSEAVSPAFCGLLTPAEKLQALAPPASFRAEERLCFEQCFSGLGQCEAAQECERLDYYTARFEAFLQQAQQEAAACAGLSCRLGFAAGAVFL